MKLYHNGEQLKVGKEYPASYIDDFEISWDAKPGELYTLYIANLLNIEDTRHNSHAFIVNIPMNDINLGTVMSPYKKFHIPANITGFVPIYIYKQKKPIDPSKFVLKPDWGYNDIFFQTYGKNLKTIDELRTVIKDDKLKLLRKMPKVRNYKKNK